MRSHEVLTSGQAANATLGFLKKSGLALMGEKPKPNGPVVVSFVKGHESDAV